MPVIEILAYATENMDEFLDFVEDGKRKPNGEYETDGEGRKITGVIKWLQGRGVPEAHFFNSPNGQDVNLFASTVQKPEDHERPWMKEIPGFEVMVKTDGLIGMTTDFAPIGDLLASVVSNPDLDKKFDEEKIKVNKILELILQDEKILSLKKEAFLAALRGDKETNPDEVFREVNRKLQISL